MQLLTFFCLLALSAKAAALPYHLPEFTFPFDNPRERTYIIAPDNTIYGQLALALVRRLEQPLKLQANVEILDNDGVVRNRCSLDLTVRMNAITAGIHWFRQISYEIVLLTWYDKVNFGDRRVRLALLNITNCRLIDHGIDEMPVKHIVVPLRNNSATFDIIVNDKTTCREFGEICRIRYDQTINKFRYPQRFDVNVKWESLVVRPVDADTFLVRGFDAQGSYRVLLFIRSTGVAKKLMSLPNANPRLEIMSSDLSVCWIANPGRDRSVNCAQFNEKTQVLFTKTVDYPEPVTLVAIQNLSEGELFLLVGKIYCRGSDCWNVYKTQLSRDKPLDNLYLMQLPCSGDRKFFIFSGSRISDGLLAKFTCENVNGIHHVTTIF